MRGHRETGGAGSKVFEADLALERQPRDRGALQQRLVACPWRSLRTGAGIDWQALRLLIERTPSYDHTTSQHDLALGEPAREEHDRARTDLER